VKLLNAVLSPPRVKQLLTTDHFSVDETLIEAWASMKRFKTKTPRLGTPCRRRTPAWFSRLPCNETKRSPHQNLAPLNQVPVTVRERTTTRRTISNARSQPS
jgi:hypothetical protein